MVVDDLIDLVRCHLAVVLVHLTLLIPLIAPCVQAAEDFKVYRLQQFDLVGISHGSRSHLVSSEAKALGTKNALRKCLVVKWQNMSLAKLQQLIQQAVGAMLIILPADLSALAREDKENFQQWEQQYMHDSFSIPIFVAFESRKLLALLADLEQDNEAELAATATQALANAVWASGFQLVTTLTSAKPLNNFKMFNIVAKLSSAEPNDETPTIAIIAHYDSFSIVPALSFGADADASGVAALLELARLFSRLYQSSRTRAAYNVVFILSAGGKFNYQGLRSLLEESQERKDNPFHNLQFAMCFDMLGKGNQLYFHVSRPPRAETPMAAIFEQLRLLGESTAHPLTLVHKKINLGEDYFGWEHERLSMKKLPGFTLSHLSHHKDPSRTSLLDLRQSVDIKSLAINVNVVFEALVRCIYNVTHVSELQLAVNSLEVNNLHLKSWVDSLTAFPRSAQTFADGVKHPILVDLLQALDHYTKDAQFVPVSVDKKDAEFIFYEGATDTMHIYSIKSAIFDLLLAVLIAGYIGIIYLFIVNFFTIQYWLQRMFSRLKLKEA